VRAGEERRAQSFRPPVSDPAMRHARHRFLMRLLFGEHVLPCTNENAQPYMGISSKAQGQTI
jgi:hypothetical protein